MVENPRNPRNPRNQKNPKKQIRRNNDKAINNSWNIVI